MIETYKDYLLRILASLRIGRIVYDTYTNKEVKSYGLCGINNFIGRHNKIHYYHFRDDLRKFKENRKVYYTIDGTKTQEKDQFIFKATSLEPRVKLLQKLIDKE